MAQARMRRVYLIDDHQLVREGLRGLLEAAGHTVAGEAADTLTAVREVGALAPDIVLLDLMLGEGSGLLFLTQFKQTPLAAKTIVLSMSNHLPHLREAQALGAKGYVLKGASSSELLEAIETVATGGSYVSAALRGAVTTMQTAMQSIESRLATLSARERQIMELVVRGNTSADIAARVFLSPKTVETYRSRLMRKLEVSDVTGLVRLAMRCGMFDPES